MRCIFCKQPSDNTKSIEHIVPESLGNKNHVLPKGYVCDKCNNYFSHKIERPFLEQKNIRLLRFEESIPNKKSKIPAIEAAWGYELINIRKKEINGEEALILELTPEQIIQLYNNAAPDILVLPAFDSIVLPPQSSITSRFIGKIAFEFLSIKIADDKDWLDFLIDSPQFDAIRNHVRLGTTPNWPCSIRRIYDSNTVWDSYDNESFQIIFESVFFSTTFSKEQLTHEGDIETDMYFVISLWGIEYAINLAGPEIEGYKKWLADHDNVSPLYFKKSI